MNNQAAIDSQVRPDSYVFDRWAQVYDTQSNPLLLLEERKATPLLPKIKDGTVLDVGCGTGRWLKLLEAFGPFSLTGIDCSAAMLKRARDKVHPLTTLQHGDCSVLPGEDAHFTLVMASFLSSYVRDLRGFALECARVLRPEGLMLLSDMHPATAADRGWRRSFNIDQEKVDIEVESRSLAEVIAVFQQAGFEIKAFIEPSFEEPERFAFENAGKAAEFEKLVGIPAIYILKLQKRRSFVLSRTVTRHGALQLTNARAAFDAVMFREGAVLIDDGHIISIENDADAAVQALNLNGYILLPGLINAHEHLEFGLFPNLGRTQGSPPYQNTSEWAREIHQIHSSVIQLYKQIPKTTHLWWGAIRNLLCGVTTVCHHNPLYEELTHPDFPVRVVTDFGWSHSLAFDLHVGETFRDTPGSQPFIIHAGEGIDDDSRKEIAQLDGVQTLGERTILVHGLACTESEISLINRRSSSLVVCPTSNRFLFAKTLSRELLASVKHLALGSDSPLTAAGDLLDEVRYLAEVTGLDADTVYGMVTCKSAQMFHLTDGQGQIAKSGIADLIAVRSPQNTPAGALSGLSYANVELVLRAGRVQMVSADLYSRLPRNLRIGLQCLDVAGHQRWVRAPLRALFDAAENVLGQGKLLLCGRRVRALESV